MTDARALPPRLITRWATQAGREPAALSRDRARLDTRGFADLLAEAAHLGGLVGFQEAERLTGGDWRSVLAADPTMVLALLATIDVEGRSEGLQSLIERARAAATTGEAERLLGRLLDGLVRFAVELDEWLAPAAGGEIERHAAQHLIEASIERVLAPQLRALLAEVAAAEAAGLLRDVLPRRHRLRDQWRLALIEAEVVALRDELERVWIDRLLDRTAEVAETFVQELRDIAAHSAAALDSTLGSGNHSPQVAMVMAFARIFRHAQDRLNDVPQEIVRFYQDEVLRDPRRGASPDSLFLTIVPRPHSRPRIEAGTLFAAGKDASDVPIGFAADSTLEVTGARLAQLRLWTQVREHDEGIERVEARLFMPGPDGEVGDAAAGIAAPAPSTAVCPAAVIAAPDLPKGGGTRRITLALSCSALPEAVSAVVLAACVRVSVSTEGGWQELGALEVTPRWHVEAGTIRVAFELAPDKPLLAPCPAGTADAPDEVALRLALDQERVAGAIDPWALLGGVTLSGARLDVAVKDSGDLAVSTSSGPSSAAGAAPFGTPPYPGGWMRIDHPVLTRPLERLLLHYDWAALPPGPDGFAGYYREYEVDLDRRLRHPPLFTNQSFMVTIAAPVPGWDAALLRPLFAPADPAATPPVAEPPPDIFDPDERFAAPPVLPAPAGPLAPSSWFAAAASGAPDEPIPDHVLVTLATPQEGFGDAVYPANVAHAAALLAYMEAPIYRRSLLRRLWARIKALLKKIGALLLKIIKAPAKLLSRLDAVNQGYNSAPPDEPEEEEVLELEVGPDASAIVPNPPFHPMLSAIRLDYALSVADDALALFHARPLEALEAAAGLAGSRLFAPLPDRPTIDCALAGARPGDELSLLVRLGPPRGPDNEIAAAPRCYYRALDGWRELPAEARRADGTEGLSTTGLLRIAFPADAALIPDEQDPDEDKHALWLRMILPAGAAVPPIQAVTPDALSATRMLGEGAPTFAPVAAGTIVGLPGVARVVQPLDSGGGRPAEDAAMQRRRVAERVRHRGRGLLGWDIERLVLAEFPAIHKVRVLAAGDPAAGPPAGDVTVIVVPAQGGADPPDRERPRALPQLRDSIKRYVQAAASPFARVCVVDPVYAAVHVKAKIVVEANCGEALRSALGSFLSPWADPGLDLDDAADEEAVRAAIAAFLLAQPGVAGLDLLEVVVAAAAASPGWRVPVAGVLDLNSIAIERAALPW